MAIKVKQSAYLKVADIFIHKIECTAENLAKLIDVFDFKNKIEITVDMGFADEESFLFEKIEIIKAQYKSSFEKNKYTNGLFRLKASSNECKEFLKDVFEFEIEIVSVVSVKDELLWEQNSSNNEISYRRLVKSGVLGVVLTVVIEEYTIAVTINKNAYNTKQLISKIKNLFLPHTKGGHI